jgi:hypothetical protein
MVECGGLARRCFLSALEDQHPRHDSEPSFSFSAQEASRPVEHVDLSDTQQTQMQLTLMTQRWAVCSKLGSEDTRVIKVRICFVGICP